MAKQAFDREQIGSILIQVSAKSVTECMAGNAVGPPQSFFMSSDIIGDMLVVKRLAVIPLLRKQPVSGAHILRKRIPVLQDGVPSCF